MSKEGPLREEDFTVETYNLNEYPHKISAVGNVSSKKTSDRQTIVGARFDNFDPKSQTVTIKVDQPNQSGFWLELRFTLPELQRFTNPESELMNQFDSDSDSDSDSYILEEVDSD